MAHEFTKPLQERRTAVRDETESMIILAMEDGYTLVRGNIKIGRHNGNYAVWKDDQIQFEAGSVIDCLRVVSSMKEDCPRVAA